MISNKHISLPNLHAKQNSTKEYGIKLPKFFSFRDKMEQIIADKKDTNLVNIDTGKKSISSPFATYSFPKYSTMTTKGIAKPKPLSDPQGLNKQSSGLTKPGLSHLSTNYLDSYNSITTTHKLGENKRQLSGVNLKLLTKRKKMSTERLVPLTTKSSHKKGKLSVNSSLTFLK